MEYFDCQTDTLYTTTKEYVVDTCEGCAGRTNLRLCNDFTDTVSCNAERVIWIKSEKKVTEPNGIPTFTPEQITYLQQVFQIDATQEVLPVKDGFTKKGDTVWWRGECGPQQVLVEKDWDNIKSYPNVYSVKEPKYKIVYED